MPERSTLIGDFILLERGRRRGPAGVANGKFNTQKRTKMGRLLRQLLK
jgi:hypothetical protein